MPESCDECALRSLGFGKMFCPITGEDVSNQDYAKNRHEKCPLVEIHTPHGDLIDSADIIDEINRVTFVSQYDYNTAYDIVGQADVVVEAEE